MQQRSYKFGLSSGPPWSPFSVTLIALMLPPGGAALTVWNLARLQVIDRRLARQLTVAVLVIFTLGMGTLLGVAPSRTGTVPTVDPGAFYVLSIGVAIASSVSQRAAFRSWRSAHVQSPTSSFLVATCVALVYSFAVAMISVPIYLIVGQLFSMGPSGSGLS